MSAQWSDLPSSLRAEQHGAVAVLKLARAQKRNALDDPTVLGIEAFFTALPDDIRAVVIARRRRAFFRRPRSQRTVGAQHVSRASIIRAPGIARSSRSSSAKCRSSRCCTAPWSAADLSLRPPRMSALPSARRTMRCPKAAAASMSAAAARCGCRALIGIARVMDMMLTGRTLSAEEGQAIGLTQYLVETGRRASPKAWSLRTASPAMRRSPISPSCRFCRASPTAIRRRGSSTKSLAAAIAQGDEEAKARLKAFLEKRGPKVVRS